MANALGVYRAKVVATDDPQGLGRVQLSVTRKVKGALVEAQGWAATGAAPLGAGVVAAPVYAPGDTVLYAADKQPFEGAVVLCLVGQRAASAAAPWSATVSLGQGQQAVIEAAGGALQISTSAGHQVSLQADGSVAVTAPARLSVTAADVHVAAGIINVDAGTTKFSGVVQCDTLIANAVVASSYTPGVGNVW